MSPGLWSILIQGAGSAATVVASVVVAWRLGLAAQGEFALLRTWSDAGTVALTLGLPQGLLQLVYREGVPAAALHAFIWRVLGVVAATMLAVAALAGLGVLSAPATTTHLVLVALALPFWVAHRLWRSLMLKSQGVVRHAWLTAMPAILMLLGVVVMAWGGLAHGFAWMLLGVALSCAAVSAWTVKAARRLRSPWPRGVMWSVSLQTWLQGLSAALMPAVLLSLAGLLGASLADVGVISLGLQVYQVFAVLAVYAAPVVFDRAARRDRARHPASLSTLSDWPNRLGWPGAAAAIACAVLGPWFAALVWPDFAAHQLAITVMALAGLLALAVRLWVTLLQAAGRIHELSLQAIWRLALAGALTAWWTLSLGAMLAVPLALLVVEGLTLLQLAWSDRSRAATQAP